MQRKQKKPGTHFSFLPTSEEEVFVMRLMRTALCRREQNVTKTAVMRAALRAFASLPEERQLEIVDEVCDEDGCR